MFPIWDDRARGRLTMFLVGLGAGLLVWTFYPTTPQIVETTKTVVKTVEVTKEVVKWRDRVVDRVTTITKPGEVITVVEKVKDTSGEHGTENKTENTTSKEAVKITAQSRYSLGAEITINRAFAVTGAMRVGSLPLWLTGSAGDMKIDTILPRFSVGVRWEF